MEHPKTIIELDYNLDTTQEDKLKSMLEILFNKDQERSINIFNSKYYSFESQFATEIANDIMKERAADAVDSID